MRLLEGYIKMVEETPEIFFFISTRTALFSQLSLQTLLPNPITQPPAKMHATGLFTALLLGASSASAAAVLDARAGAVQTSVTLFDGTGGASSNTTSSGTSQTFSVNVGNCCK